MSWHTNKWSFHEVVDIECLSMVLRRLPPGFEGKESTALSAAVLVRRLRSPSQSHNHLHAELAEVAYMIGRPLKAVSLID